MKLSLNFFISKMGIRMDSLYGVAMRLSKMTSLVNALCHRGEGQARPRAGGTESQLSRHWSCQHPLGKWMLGTESRVGRPLPCACRWGGDERSIRAPRSNPEPLTSQRGSNTRAQPPGSASSYPCTFLPITPNKMVSPISSCQF